MINDVLSMWEMWKKQHQNYRKNIGFLVVFNFQLRILFDLKQKILTTTSNNDRITIKFDF